MLYLVTGASGAGKTACLSRLRELSPGVIWHDFDDVGVPADADKVWRQHTTEYWSQKVIDTTAMTIEEVAVAISRWVRDRKAKQR
jgi:broad-specificity NMP kinase